MVFRSRISIIIIVLLGAAFACALIPSTIHKDLIGLGVMVVTLVFVVAMFLSTCYIIDGKTLYVRTFPFTRGTAYDLEKVVRISPTRSLLSSPALSLKRIKLDFGVGMPLIISPRAQDVFLDEVRKINPKVEIIL